MATHVRLNLEDIRSRNWNDLIEYLSARNIRLEEDDNGHYLSVRIDEIVSTKTRELLCHECEQGSITLVTHVHKESGKEVVTKACLESLIKTQEELEEKLHRNGVMRRP